MSYSTTVDPSVIRQWVAEKFDVEKVKEHLHSMGCNEEQTGVYLEKFRSVKNSGKRTAGFACLAGGGFLGFASCVLTLINPVPSLYEFILYGLTSVSVLVIFLGLYFLFE